MTACTHTTATLKLPQAIPDNVLACLRADKKLGRTTSRSLWVLGNSAQTNVNLIDCALIELRITSPD